MLEQPTEYVKIVTQMKLKMKCTFCYNVQNTCTKKNVISYIYKTNIKASHCCNYFHVCIYFLNEDHEKHIKYHKDRKIINFTESILDKFKT